MGKLSPRMAAVAVASVAAYLGLAVLGWGGVGPFFAEPARVALVVVTVALTAAALFTEGNLSMGEMEDRSNRWVIAAIGVLGVLGAWLPAYTERHGIGVMDGDALRWVGVALYTVGGVLRLVPVFVLGRRFSGLVAIQTGHELVTGGVYRVIRHPSYLGLMLGALGWGLAFRSVTGVVIAVLNLVPLVARIRAEERLLAAHFGAEYAAYRARTWRLVPGVY